MSTIRCPVCETSCQVAENGLITACGQCRHDFPFVIGDREGIFDAWLQNQREQWQRQRADRAKAERASQGPPPGQERVPPKRQRTERAQDAAGTRQRPDLRHSCEAPGAPNPRNGLRANCNALNIFLSWDWPEGCVSATVGYARGSKGFFHQHDANVRFSVRKDVYDRDGGYSFDVTDWDYYGICVWLHDDKGQHRDTLHRVVNLFGPERVYYRLIIKSKFFGGVTGAALEFKYKAGATLDGLIVIAQQHPSANPRSGTFIMSIDRLHFQGDRVHKDIPSNCLHYMQYYKVFFADDDKAQSISLMPVGESDIQLR